MVGKPDKPLRRYYVTMTWEQWPKDGSYGTVVEATSYEEAEEKCREEMAAQRSKEAGFDPEEWKPDEGEEPMDPEDMEDSPESFLKDYGSSWHVVDCFLLDEFIAMHSKKEEANV